MISSAIIEEIKYRNDIEDVISQYVTLKRAGSNMNGLCPFHSEKTPSFTIFKASHSFYCFGCGAGGDVITFIMKIENLDYIGALEFLAKRVGINIPADNKEPERGIKKSRIIEMNRAAAKFFHEQLKESREAQSYLERRQLPMSLIKHFGIGYAPNEFGRLTDHMHSLGFTDEELITGFLCGKSQKTGRAYDYFRGRIMFPILDVSGDVIAFGGRVIDDTMPKYLNSSDTPAFKKSRNLFALNFAKNSCSEQIILCEGYMDVIALHGAGFSNAVATLGTALTAEQARLIKRYSKSVIISYDSDEAGQRAANRAFMLLGEAGLQTKILKMENAKDPDEFIKKFGAVRFRQIIDNSYTEFDFKFNVILKKYDINNSEEKIKAANETTELIAGIYSSVERDIYIAKAAKMLEIIPESMKNDIERIIKKNRKHDKREETKKLIRKSQGFGDRVNPDFMKNVKAANAEEVILGMMLKLPEFAKRCARDDTPLKSEDFVSDFSKRVFDSIVKHIRTDEEFDIGLMNGEFSESEMSRIIKMQISREDLSNTDKVFREAVDALKAARAKEEASLDDILKAKRKSIGRQIE